MSTQRDRDYKDGRWYPTDEEATAIANLINRCIDAIQSDTLVVGTLLESFRERKESMTPEERVMAGAPLYKSMFNAVGVTLALHQIAQELSDMGDAYYLSIQERCLLYYALCLVGNQELVEILRELVTPTDEQRKLAGLEDGLIH